MKGVANWIKAQRLNCRVNISNNYDLLAHLRLVSKRGILTEKSNFK